MTPLVERLARALDVWNLDGLAAPGDWCLRGDQADPLVIVVASKRGVRISVDEPIALLVLVAYARGLTVDMGPCPACGGRPWRGTRYCLACQYGDLPPTGRDVRPLVRVLLDAATPAKIRKNCSTCGDRWQIGAACTSVKETDAQEKHWRDEGLLVKRIAPRQVLAYCPDCYRPRDPASRNALAVKADELAQAGDPLAEPLAAFMGGECRTCEGAGNVLDDHMSWTNVMGGRECPDCNGHGTMLGALAPTLEEMAAEEWLARVDLCPLCFGTGTASPTAEGPIMSQHGDVSFILRDRQCEACNGEGGTIKWAQDGTA